MKILEFKATPGFGEYKKLFDPISIKHPAKINQNLLRYLIKNYTNEGDLILDPMAGTFSTSVMAMILNRNSIGIDLEEKFVNWGKKNIEITEKYPQLSKKGKAIVLKGDSRKLSSLLSESKEEIDTIISSPPYSRSMNAQNPIKTWTEEAQKKWWENYRSQGGGMNFKDFIEYQCSKQYSYSTDKSNIGALPHGKVDMIISSPPYSEGIGHSQGKRVGKDKIGKDRFYGYYANGDKKNIGNLPHGKIDTIISSPPYVDSKKGKENAEEFAKRSEKVFKKEWKTGKNRHTPGRMRAQEALTSGYSESNENIGNLKLGEVDIILTSPPYENSFGASRHGEKVRTRSCELHKEKSLPHPYTIEQKKDNIGNLKKQTYLEAMYEVYAESFKVLKPNGKMILILKNFVRNKKVIPLTEHTIAICEKAGFKLVDRLKFKLPTKSFWRTLYSKKYPEVDTTDLNFEHILVFEGSGTLT